MIATSISSSIGSRSMYGVNGSSRYEEKCSSTFRSRVAARPSITRLLRSSAYLRFTASRSKEIVVGIGHRHLVEGRSVDSSRGPER